MESERLLGLLRRSVRDLVGMEREAAIAFSGGLDSSMIARLASEVCPVRCYSSAVRGSHDAEHAKEAAEDLGLDFEMIDIEPDSIGRACARAARATGSLDPVRIAYTVPTTMVVERCRERLVLAGNLADELFGGYAKYARMEDPSPAMKEDLGRALLEARAIAVFSATLGKKVAFPFASEAVVSFSEALPLSEKVAGERRKIVLREAARLAGVKAYDRPKKAAQYSSGMQREMKRLAKKDGLSLSEWVAGVASGAEEGARD